MRRKLLVALVVSAAGALKPPQVMHAVERRPQRRDVLGGVAAPLASVVASVVVPGLFLASSPAAADVPVDPFNSMCLGFGCNAVQGLDRANEAPEPVGEASIAWPKFLALLDEGKVSRVEFLDINMETAYALIKGAAPGDDDLRVRIGEGYPLERGNSWSSTLFVARILQNKGINYTFLTELKRRGAR